MNINKEISEIASGANDKPIEVPNEIKDILTDNHDIDDNQENSDRSVWSDFEHLKDDIRKNVSFRGAISGGIINTSKFCGCNNTCGNACTNACMISAIGYAREHHVDIKFVVK